MSFSSRLLTKTSSFLVQSSKIRIPQLKFCSQFTTMAPTTDIDLCVHHQYLQTILTLTTKQSNFWDSERPQGIYYS